MDKQAIIADMLELLQGTLDAHVLDEGGDAVRATPELVLIGETAAVSSMALVSFIADVESTLQEKNNLTVTLVSERALSRKKSPFRSVDALAEYVVELVENPAEISA
ncbi:MAG: hypothetical protein IPF98_08780 [Gemmatimonadetes bacterium]|nr:hypothetical protein [Gemmatimonadota bacterium]MCC6774008.1 hypothetical protein [Gemmatimonadaceae bacterium]